jgi:hypothetical protein
MPGHWLDELAEKANRAVLRDIEADRKRRRKQRALRRNRKVVRLLKEHELDR